ncbi:MAG: NAD-dependent epimerase/dehydratase family protein [Cellulosilyticaceae bacterium]
MKTILITGAQGFIGKNLVATLSTLGTFNLKLYDTHNTLTELDTFINEADFIIHLAGVNRSDEHSDFQKVNVNLTQYILTSLDRLNKVIPIIATSSTQAHNATPYGQSKAAMESLLLDWSEQAQANVLIYRLPNVFGKWSRPNYNSAVATFCHNISRGLPITIYDPLAPLRLVYIDDVIHSFLQILTSSPLANSGFCSSYPTYELTVGELADKLYAYHKQRDHLTLSSFENPLDKKLFATYLSFLEPHDFAYPLTMKTDPRGWLAEFIKSKELGQIFVSKTLPGITRGNHWHHTKVEKFLVLSGDASICFRNILNTDVITYHVSGDHLQVVDIPVGYTHSITNVGQTDVITLFWSSEIFDPLNPDTFYEEVTK